MLTNREMLTVLFKFPAVDSSLVRGFLLTVCVEERDNEGSQPALSLSPLAGAQQHSFFFFLIFSFLLFIGMWNGHESLGAWGQTVVS